MTYTPDDEQMLIAKIVNLENDIERAEGAKALRLSYADATLNQTLRRLRRERAGYLSRLLGEVPGDTLRHPKAA